MAANEIHQNDLTTFEIEVYDGDTLVDISGATTKQIKFYDPTGTTTTKTASFTTDGTDGKMDYTCVADDLDVVGTWQYQGYLVMPGFTGHTDIHRFQVYANL